MADERKLPPLPERETLRLHQANERTMLAWMRTALAMMGFGFVLARFGLFLREIAAATDSAIAAHRSAPFSLALGIALASLGVLTIALALARYRSVEQAIERHEVGRPASAMVYVLGALIAALGVAIVAVLIATG